MKKILLIIKNKLTFLGAVMLAAVVGGTTVALVSAAVPDNNGQISACYRTNGGDLRLVDTANPTDVCSNKETPISWQKREEPIYGEIYFDGDADPNQIRLDTVRSKGVNSIFEIHDPNFGYMACVDLARVPKIFSITGSNPAATSGGSINPNRWQYMFTEGFENCPQNTDLVVGPVSQSLYFTAE